MHAKKLVYLILTWLLAMPLYASSIGSASVSEVTNHSALVFEGRVSGSRVVQTPGSRALHTLVTFEILDVLKGDYSEPAIELSFLGGSKGDITMHVTDLHRPRMGDRGIYFVENPIRTQVNPLYGWDQGHYLLKYQPALGRMAVTTRDGKAVYALDSKTVTAVSGLSHGVATGVITTAGSVVSQPMTVDEFKHQIMGVMK